MRIVHQLGLSLALKTYFSDAQVATGKFYVDSQTCVRDCVPGDPLFDVPTVTCGGIVTGTWPQLFSTVAQCCSFKLSWIDPDMCADISNPVSTGTDKFWADTQNGFCRKDCVPNTDVNCVRATDTSIILHDNIATCCNTELHYVDPLFCDTRSIETHSNGWVTDWNGLKCVQDTAAQGHREPSTTIFNTVGSCCSTDLGWLIQTKCVSDSLGVGDTFSNEWYVDWGTFACVKDCDEGLGGHCGGNRPDASLELFPSRNICCTAKLGWLPTAVCTGGVVPPPPSTCQTDSECKQVCQAGGLGAPGTCQAAPVVIPPVCTCPVPKTVPDKCELQVLIDVLEFVFSGNPKLFAQSVRASFHDAGTFDQNIPEGGANGCLMNDPTFVTHHENDGLQLPVPMMKTIKDFWNNLIGTCLSVSSADIIQFAAFFSVVRQTGVPGLTTAKRRTLLGNSPAHGNVFFTWGRLDEANCDDTTISNLPEFSPGPHTSFPERCEGAGGEIKEKMMDRNGFTAKEATALIGAHTIGVIRTMFGQALAGPWVLNGADVATPEGPVFDNAYHHFLINTIVENNANNFATAPPFFGNPATMVPFTRDFETWFRDDPNGLDHLDSDLALAFPTLNPATYPDFHPFTDMYAGDNNVFLEDFLPALDKMSKLGVTNALLPPSACDACSPTGTNRRLSKVGTRSLQTSTLEYLTTADMIFLIKNLGRAVALSDDKLMDIQFSRREEIKNLTGTSTCNITTPVPPSTAPTSNPTTPVTLSPAPSSNPSFNPESA